MNRKHELCTVEGCTRPHKSKGYCRAHYMRHLRGKPMAAPMRAGDVPACSVAGCTDEAHARGLCLTHYARQRRGSSVETLVKRRNRHQPEHCTEPDCAEPVKAKGLCQTHYARLLRHGHTKYPDRTTAPKPCTVAGCENHVYANGICSRHYLRFRKAATFGLTPEQVAAMLAAQDGRCAICGGEESSRDGASGKLRELNLDHCHANGLARGLLCNRCNRGLGYFLDDPARLRAAAAYLERHIPSA
jgi:hypothetical protein